MSERIPLVVFEGIAGAGKGTQLKNTTEWLRSIGKRVFISREHTRGMPIGDLIEDIIKGKLEKHDPVALQMLFVADRANHTQRLLIPCLTDGRFDLGLEDRYEASTVAYAPKDERAFFLELNRKVTIRPDLTIILDLEPVEAVKRVHRRNDSDIFDNVKKLRNCRDGYRWYFNNSGWPCAWVDASGTEEDVFERVRSELIQRKVVK